MKELTWDFVPGKRNGRDGEELYDNRVYKELQCDIKSKFSRELSVQRTTHLSILSRHFDRQRDDDEIAEGSHANRSTSRQEEQIVPGTLSSPANYNSGTSKRVLYFFLSNYIINYKRKVKYLYLRLRTDVQEGRRREQSFGISHAG